MKAPAKSEEEEEGPNKKNIFCVYLLEPFSQITSTDSKRTALQIIETFRGNGQQN